MNRVVNMRRHSYRGHTGPAYSGLQPIIENSATELEIIANQHAFAQDSYFVHMDESMLGRK